MEELGKLLRCLLIVQNQSAGFKLPAYFSKVEHCGKDRYSMEQLTTLPREGMGGCLQPSRADFSLHMYSSSEMQQCGFG